MDKRGGWLLPLAVLAATSCSSAGKLDIRAVGEPLGGTNQPVSARVALAQGQLVLGNVALALEQFRRAEREQPGSVAALAGMADCYDRMGRADLARRYYEQALAAAPEEPAIYQALADSVEQQGLAEEAGSLRREAADRVAHRAPPVMTAAGSVTELPRQAAAAVPDASVTMTLPASRPAATARTGVRLERLSTGEVALVSGERSLWTARKVASNPRSVTIRFEKRQPMVVLNGARVAGIAARTRDYLAARGFAAASIGDAPARRAQTLIRYPQAERTRAGRIAAQFPFATILEPGQGPLTLIVGRDAAARGLPRAG